jgi:hypothetical protein
MEDGRRWKEGFADGLRSADVLVTVLSRAALAPCADLTARSDTCDIVVLSGAPIGDRAREARSVTRNLPRLCR